MTITIEKDIPVPDRSGPETVFDYSQLPIVEMSVGDSFLVPDVNKEQKSGIRGFVTRQGKALRRTYVTRVVNNGNDMRVWRVD